MTTSYEIKKWLKATNNDRVWLAAECGVSLYTVNGWLSANRPISGASTRRIRELMQQGSGGLDLQLTLAQFNKATQLAALKGMSLNEWIADIIKQSLKDWVPMSEKQDSMECL